MSAWTRRSALASLLFLVLPMTSASLLAAPATVAEQLRSAKALFFDGRFAEARQAWESVRAASRGPESVSALYWIARCSEKLGEHERALREYAAFLAARPSDRPLVEESRTSRVGLAARLYKAGQKQHAAVLTSALADPSRTVRYYAALQVATLGPEMARPAVPVLLEIGRELVYGSGTAEDILRAAADDLIREAMQGVAQGARQEG